MSSTQEIDAELRERLITDPEMILDDTDIMRALISANERAMGGNVVDMRGVAMDRLEARLDRLEETHRAVIAAAYENLSGTQQVHRAILRMLDPMDFEAFLRDLDGEVAHILRVDAVRLVLETAQDGAVPAAGRLGDVLSVGAPGDIRAYLCGGRDAPMRQVTLRGIDRGAADIYGAAAPGIRSEACLVLDFGGDRLPGMLVLGAEDPQRFGPQQGTDLLAFLGGVFEREMRRWLS